MSFLDNSGDIILDAVLTDAGRERLARGDGSFKITKFALGDDEIDYALYNLDDPRGSAFFDLEILQTPILEAFTNNTSSMKSKLITITRTNVLYLPVLKLFDSAGGLGLSTITGLAGTIPVSVDKTTNESLDTIAGPSNFYNAETALGIAVITDQGLDTTRIPPTESGLPSDLFETQYSIQMDNRLISLTDGNNSAIDVSFIDDDSIATYSVAYTTSAEYPIQDISAYVAAGASSIAGPRGTRLRIGLQASIDLQDSTYLFTTLGSTTSVTGTGSETYNYIDTNLRIIGLTTGYRIDIPVRLLKL
jgi:hypothetical protein